MRDVVWDKNLGRPSANGWQRGVGGRLEDVGGSRMWGWGCERTIPVLCTYGKSEVTRFRLKDVRETKTWGRGKWGCCTDGKLEVTRGKL